MSKSRRLQPVAVALVLSVLLSSCLASRRIITRGRGHKQVDGTAPPLKVATGEDLSAIIARNYNAIDSFQALDVTLTASQGSVHEGNIKDYKSFPAGFIIFRKADSIRIRAYVPVVGNLALDMVSTGNSFRFLLPSKNTLFEGLNSAPAHSPNRMENLRPDAFLSSMLIRPVDSEIEVAMLKDDTDEDNALYRLELNRKTPNGILVPGRDIWFDREDLTIARQKIYDSRGNIISDTSYSKWQMFNGVPFPVHIDINRRIDGYGVAIELDKDKMEMNKEVPSSKFELIPSELEGATRKVIE